MGVPLKSNMLVPLDLRA